jgi:DNA-binding NarL/FixJ family response regulator
LTRRERQIVELLLEGCSNKDIASRLSVSDRTIKNQLSALYRKTNVRSRLELVAFVLRSGIR